jgi:hypothetical protein
MTPGKSITEALAESPAAALIARCKRADQAARLVASALGEPASSPSLPTFTCQIREHTLIVFAASVAQAAKLRQRVPRLLAILQERGLNLNEIRVRVQPGPSAEADPMVRTTPASTASNAAEARQATAATLAFADELARKLRPSPLREAAVRLARRLRADR